MKEKWFSIYGSYATTVLICGHIAWLMIGLITQLLILYKNKTNIAEYLPLALFLIVPPMFAIILEWKQGYIQRILLRFRIDCAGFHLRGFGSRPYSILWSEIHTYGVYFYAVSYRGMNLLFFSKDRNELAETNVQKMNLVDQTRIVMDYSESLWDELKKHMPKDMQKQYHYSISHHKNGFFKR